MSRVRDFIRKYPRLDRMIGKVLVKKINARAIPATLKIGPPKKALTFSEWSSRLSAFFDELSEGPLLFSEILQECGLDSVDKILTTTQDDVDPRYRGILKRGNPGADGFKLLLTQAISDFNQEVARELGITSSELLDHTMAFIAFRQTQADINVKGSISQKHLNDANKWLGRVNMKLYNIF